jgi:hypothetical protein
METTKEGNRVKIRTEYLQNTTLLLLNRKDEVVIAPKRHAVKTSEVKLYEF